MLGIGLCLVVYDGLEESCTKRIPFDFGRDRN